MDTPKRRVWGERRPKDKVTLQIILVLTLTCPKTFTRGCVSVFEKYLDGLCVSVSVIYIYIYIHTHTHTHTHTHSNMISVNVKKLDVIYTYTHNIGLDLHYTLNLNKKPKNEL
jgi:hypothetical protein